MVRPCYKLKSLRLKKSISTKILGGAILLTLSGFVPKITRPVQAASATVSASGTFSGGIQITPQAGATVAQFGRIVATAPAGTVRVTPGGGTTAIGGFFNGGTQKQAIIQVYQCL